MPHEGARVDQFIAAHLNISRSRAQTILAQSTVNGKTAKPSQALRAGDVIELVADVLAPVPTAEPVPSAKLEGAAMPPVLFEDEHLMILDKPRGLAVHPGAGERQATLVDVLRHSGRSLSGVGPPERAGIVHRLDKETSGLITVCKTDVAHWKLAEDFAERRVHKIYAALVCGVPPERGRIEVPIARHPVHRKKMAVQATGRPAITEYRRLRHWQKFAQLEIDLMTGRTHQIRVHLAYIHYPVVGDVVYGGEARALQSTKDAELLDALKSLSGQTLHAQQLQFEHPITGKQLEFESPLPEDMVRIIGRLNEL